MVRVLIAEDESVDRTFYRGVLSTVVPTAAVVEAPTLSRATAAIKGPPFDLALVDLALAADREAGVRLVQLLKRTPDTAIIVISGLDVATFRPRLFRAQVWDYFDKPVDEASLAAIIRRTLATRANVPEGGSHPVPGLELPRDGRTAPSWHGVPIEVSQTDRRVLAELVRTPNRLVRRDVFAECFVRSDRDAERIASSLSTAIYRIRRAFAAVDVGFDRIEAVGSSGYLWKAC